MSEPPQDRPQGQTPPGQGPQQPTPPQGQPRPPQQGPPPQPGQGYPPQPGQGYPPQPGPQGYPQPGPQGYPPRPGPQGYPQPGYPPQQGYPQQGPVGGYGPGPQGGGYGPGGPGGPQPYGRPPQPGEPKKRTGLFVLIGAGALALLLAVVAVAVNLGGRDDTADGGSTTSGGGGGSSAPAAASASDAVTGYFDALTKGDAAAAVAYAADPSTVDTTYLTPEVLAASAKRAPITGVQVTPTTDPDATSVPVTYQLGSTPVSTAIEVVKSSDDTWKLVTVATDVDISSAQDPSVPMSINGTKVGKPAFSLLPGVYRLASTLKNVDLGSSPDLVVRFPSDAPDTTAISPRISSKGRAAALKAVKKSWSSCLDERAQKPKGCPNQFRYKDFNFRDSTVRWSRKGSDPFKKIKPAYADTTTLQYNVKRDLALRGTCTSGGRTGTCTGTLKGTVQVEARRSGDTFKVEWLV